MSDGELPHGQENIKSEWRREGEQAMRRACAGRMMYVFFLVDQVGNAVCQKQA